MLLNDKNVTQDILNMVLRQSEVRCTLSANGGLQYLPYNVLSEHGHISGSCKAEMTGLD